MQNLEDQEIKVILVGESGTGKTSLINSAIGLPFKEYEVTTNAAGFVTKVIKIDGKSYSLNLWDTIGQEKFRSLTKIFMKDSKIVIFVYDITNLRSFEQIEEHWFKAILEVLGNEPVLGLVGNKQDLFVKEQVKEEIAEKYAENKHISFKLTSAKNALSFNKFLEDLLKQYIKKCGGKVEGEDGKKLKDKDNKNGKERKFC